MYDLEFMNHTKINCI